MRKQGKCQNIAEFVIPKSPLIVDKKVLVTHNAMCVKLPRNIFLKSFFVKNNFGLLKVS